MGARMTRAHNGEIWDRLGAGESLTDVTSTVSVLAGLELNTPSLTVNVKLAYAVPLSSAAGLKPRMPRLMSATAMT